MRITNEKYDEITVLTLSGKILIGEGDELLREAIANAIKEGVKMVLLDITDVPYVDSAGYGEILRSFTALSRHRGVVALLNPSQRLCDLMSITKTLQLFPVYNNKEAALKALRDGTYTPKVIFE